MTNCLKNWYEKDKKLIFACLALGAVFTFFAGLGTKLYSDRMQESIAQNVIRYHVLANSDSLEDQNLKLLVKDGVLDLLEESLDPAKSLEESRGLLQSRLKAVEEESERIIAEKGYDYSVKASISQDFFPTKTYGDVTFPAGVYEALRIEIGRGSGNNWWCVMFPPLCFVDITRNELPEEAKEELAQVLDEDAFELVLKAKSEEELPVKIKFKIVEWWQNRKALG